MVVIKVKDIIKLDELTSFKINLLTLFNEVYQEDKRLIYITTSYYDILLETMNENEILILIKKMVFQKRLFNNFLYNIFL